MSGIPSIAGLALVALCLIPACSRAPRRPIATSLQNLQLDSAPIKGPVLTHHEVFSIGGLLPMPEVGVFYHYPAEQRFPNIRSTMPPSTAMGISDHNTYRLTGTIEGANLEADFGNARAAAIELRRAAQLVVALEVRRAALAAKLSRAEEAAAKKASSALTPESTASTLMALVNDVKATVAEDKAITDIKTEQGRVADDLKAAEADLKKATTNLATTTSKPGIIVAEWAVGQSRDGGLDIAPVVGVKGSREVRRSGLVILGGLRISHLYPGDDLKDLFINLQAEDRAAIDGAGLTTFLLQAKFVNYLSDFNLQERLEGYLELEAKEFAQPELILARLDRVRIEAAFSAAAALSSSGSVAGIDWQVKKLTIGKDLCAKHINDADSWQTVQAVVTSGDRLFKHWFKQLPPGAAVRLEIPTAPKGGDAAATASLEALRQPMGQLRAGLLSDRAYWAKQEVREHLQKLASAADRVQRTFSARELLAEDAADLNSAKTALDSVVAELRTEDGGISWSAMAARSTLMFKVIRDSHAATQALDRIANRPAPAAATAQTRTSSR